jgi:hypothetical protein
LRSVAERRRRAETLEDIGENVGTVARLASYVEIKPTLFGVSIDLKAILRDIAASR